MPEVTKSKSQPKPDPTDAGIFHPPAVATTTWADGESNLAGVAVAKDVHPLEFALTYAKAGIPVFPCNQDKAPYTANGFKGASISGATIRAWWQRWPDAKIGMPTGEVVALDCDGKNQENLVVDFEAAAAESGLDWLDALPKQTTPNGKGADYLFRAPAEIRNRKFAVNQEGETTIETRGVGGYIIVAPSPGYHFERGNLLSIPKLSPVRVEALLDVARSFTQKADKEATEPARTSLERPGDTLSPGDDFNARGDVAALLVKHGWQSKTKHQWRRPGKDSGISATWDKVPGKFYVFSSNASPFESETSYSPFAVYAFLEHSGDFAAACRALRADGYGGERTGERVSSPSASGDAEEESGKAEVEKEADKALESFQPIDLAPVVSGNFSQPMPAVLKRDDDRCLFYRGVINGIHGDSGTGKGWVICETIKQELAARNPVMLIDMEDTAVSIVSRLLMLGVDENDILSGLDYLQPKDKFSIPAVDSMVKRIQERRHSLVVIDSLGEAFGIEGVDENSDKDVGPWLRAVARRLAESCADLDREGPAVVLVDHSTKAADNPLYPSGSKRKRAAFGGASYLLTAPVSHPRIRTDG